MIYALNAHGLSYGNEADGILEYENEEAAGEALKNYIYTVNGRGHLKFDNLVQLYLFLTRKEAEEAKQTDDEEVTIDEGKAFRTLEWERGFGFNF